MLYNESLKPLIEALILQRHNALNVGRNVIGESLCLEDFYFISSIDKCIRIIDGFLPLIQQRNISCTGALLRMQLDNCMRLFAIYIAKNKDEVINNYISKKFKLSKFVDRNGKKMTDAYLKEQITVYEKRFNEKQLSEEHIPPKKAFNSDKIYKYDLLENVGTNKHYWDKTNTRCEISQNGFKIYTLCESCNNKTGHWYGTSYAEFVKQFTPLLTVHKGNANEIFQGKVNDIFPPRIIKQILSMFCSVNYSDKGLDTLRKFVFKQNYIIILIFLKFTVQKLCLKLLLIP